MSEVDVDLIVKAIAEGFDKLGGDIEGLGKAGRKAEEGLDPLEKTIAKTRTTIGGLDRDIKVFGKNIGSTTDMLSGLGISIPTTPMQLFGQALSFGAQQARAALDDTIAYTDSVWRLSAAIGAGTEETSRMLQVTDDFGISIEQMQSALAIASKNGFEPTVENLAKLADELAEIEDPTARAAKASEIFGRGWADLAPVLDAGGSAIREMAANVDASLLVTEEAAQEAREYQLAMDDLNDSLEATKYELARGVIPALTGFIESLTGASQVREELDAAVRSGQISFEQYSLIMGDIRGGTEDWTRAGEQLNAILEEQNREMDRLAGMASNAARSLMVYSEATRASGREGGLLAGELDNQAAWMWRVSEASKDSAGGINRAAGAVENYADAAGTAEQNTRGWMDAIDLGLVGSIATALDKIEFKQLGGENLQSLAETITAAVDSGRITPEQGKEMLNGLFVAAQELEIEMGNIDLATAAQEISSQLGVPLKAAFDLLLKFKEEALFDIVSRIRIEYTTSALPPIPGSVRPGGSGGTAGSGNNSGSGDALPFAMGGELTVPPGFPNDNFMVGLTSGEHISVQPNVGGGPGGGGVYVGDIIINGAGGDPLATADAVINEINRRVRTSRGAGAGYIG